MKTGCLAPSAGNPWPVTLFGFSQNAIQGYRKGISASPFKLNPAQARGVRLTQHYPGVPCRESRISASNAKGLRSWRINGLRDVRRRGRASPRCIPLEYWPAVWSTESKIGWPLIDKHRW